MTEKQSCHWYLAFTASRAEQRVKQELDQRKIRNYLPLRKITYQWQGRSREASCPQIARCVLIWTSLSDIRQLSGISGLIIPQNIWDYRVPEWQVESYQLLFSQMDTAVEWIPDCLESATMVRVTGGPLTGLVGELDTSDTGFRIRIRFILWDVFVLLYLKNGLKNFKNLFESTSLYEQKLNAFLSPSLGLLLSETYRWV